MNSHKLLHFSLYLKQCAMQSHFLLHVFWRNIKKGILLEKGFCTLSEETTKGFYKNQTLLTLD